MASNKVLRLLQPSRKICQPNVIQSATKHTAVTDGFIDKVIHTGQQFDEHDDSRLARFVNKRKEVNDQWAIKLIAEVPPTPSKNRIVACDGGGGPLGHPKVYINLDKPGNHSCGYCGLRFHKEDHH